MRDFRGAGISAALALSLSACVGGVEPPRSGPAPIDRDTRVTEPVRVHPVRDTGASPNIRGIQAPARIVGSVPLLPIPTAPAVEPLNAAAAGVLSGPPLGSLLIDDAQAQSALAAFVTSCPSLVRRMDTSGLTRGTDWQPACTAAASTDRRSARAFFAQWFETAQVGDGKAFATGYYEPEIAGSLERRDGYAPIYGRPDDLIDVDLGAFSTALKGKKVRGRVDRSNLVPYYDRTAIEQGAL